MAISCILLRVNITVIEDFCESSNELRIAFWFQMLEQELRMRLEVLEVRF